MCIRFFFIMRDSSFTYKHNVTLNVYKVNIDSGANMLMWSLKGYQFSYWREAKFGFTESVNKHAIMFEAVRGESVFDVAVDDISFLPTSNCPVQPTDADPNKPTTLSTSTTTKMSTTGPSTSTYIWTSQSTYDCNFEDGMCTWQNDSTAELAWIRVNGSVSSISGKRSVLINTKFQIQCGFVHMKASNSPLGPSGDHTTLSTRGYYIYLDVSFQSTVRSIASGALFSRPYLHNFRRDTPTRWTRKPAFWAHQSMAWKSAWSSTITPTARELTPSTSTSRPMVSWERQFGRNSRSKETHGFVVKSTLETSNRSIRSHSKAS